MKNHREIRTVVNIAGCEYVNFEFFVGGEWRWFGISMVDLAILGEREGLSGLTAFKRHIHFIKDATRTSACRHAGNMPVKLQLNHFERWARA